MKKMMIILLTGLLTMLLLAGCAMLQTEQLPGADTGAVKEPAESTTEPEEPAADSATKPEEPAADAGKESGEPVADSETEPGEPVEKPEADASTDESGEPADGEVQEEEDVEYEGDASSYYIDVVYAQQIERYYEAIAGQWDEKTCTDKGLSTLTTRYYEGNPLDNVGFTFMDLDGDGIWELIIGAIRNAEQDPLVLEIWALKEDEPVMLVQSDAQNRYYLQYADEDELWSVSYEAERGEDTYASYYMYLIDGVFEVSQGVIYDAAANREAPWFMAYDLDWDVSNDSAIDEDLAGDVIEMSRRLYIAVEYFPYCLYK